MTFENEREIQIHVANHMIGKHFHPLQKKNVPVFNKIQWFLPAVVDHAVLFQIEYGAY